MPILAILFMRGDGYSHSIHKAEVGPQSTKGVGYGHKGVGGHDARGSVPMM